MSEAGITLRDIYDQQLRTSTEVAAVRTDVAGLTARVEVQLAHGQKKMDELERDARALRDAMPDRLSERLTSLESDRDKERGSSGTVGRIVTAAIALGSGGIGAALIQAIHH